MHATNMVNAVEAVVSFEVQKQLELTTPGRGGLDAAGQEALDYETALCTWEGEGGGLGRENECDK